MSRLVYVLLLALIVGLAITLRLYPFSENFFPLNDGALFLVFVDHIYEGKYFSQSCVFYSGDCIPFAYPPLSFFASSTLKHLGYSSTDVAILYPLGLSFLCGIAAFFLIREITENKVVQLLALAGMLFQIRSIEYILMGGGISRATGALFFLIAMIFALRFARISRLSAAFLAAVSISFSMLSHLEWGLNSAFGLVIIVLLSSQSSLKKRILSILGIGLTSFVIFAPWLIWAVSNNGLEPFLSASDTADWGLGRIRQVLDLELFPSKFALLSVIGAVILAQRGNYVWPVMLIVFALITPRHYLSVAVFPVGILAAFGLYALAALILRPATQLISARLASPAWIGLITVYAALLAYLQYDSINRSASLQQISPDVIAAAEWAKNSFDEDASAVNISPLPWHISREAEWWPYLTGHRSLNTVQGSEWLPKGTFVQKRKLQASLLWSPSCDDWIPEVDALRDLDYLIVHADTECLDDDGRFRQVFVKGTTSIYIRSPPDE